MTKMDGVPVVTFIKVHKRDHYSVQSSMYKWASFTSEGLSLENCLEIEWTHNLVMIFSIMGQSYVYEWRMHRLDLQGT